MITIFRSDRFRRLSKEVFWITLGQAAAVVGSLVGVRLLTELLEPAEYGELALGMTVATLVNQTVLGPLGNGLTRFYASALDRGDIGSYLNAMRRLLASATGVVGLFIALTVAGLLMVGRPEWIAIATAAYVFAIVSGYNAILSGIQNAARQRSIVALHQGLDAWMRFLVAAGLLLWLGASSTVAMIGYAIAVTMVLGSQYVFFRRILPEQLSDADHERSWREQIWKYSWPMGATGIMSWGVFASQRWALELFCGTEDVGYFSAIFQIGFTPIILAGSILMTLVVPIVFRRAGDGVDKQKVFLASQSIIKFSLAGFLIILLATAMGTGFHDMVFRVLVAEQYRIASRYLPFAIFAAGMFQLSNMLSTIVLLDTGVYRLLPLYTIGNALIVLITFSGARFHGIDGLFFAMVAGSTIHLTWAIYNAKKVLTHE